MEFKDYQVQALKTDRVPTTGDDVQKGLILPMLGLAGETGQLLSEYKKHLRDGPAHRLFKARVAEELGDLLWYVSNVASKFDLDLSDIAEKNLIKVQSRWAPENPNPPTFDGGLPADERLPRKMLVKLTEVDGDRGRRAQMSIDGRAIGSLLSDNAYDADGYRFHDVFHLSYAAVLGWSPNLRSFLRCKRKSEPLIDEVEDGGRARIIEEAVSALAFDYARLHNFLEGVSEVDYGLLRTIQSMTSHLEVGSATAADWERAVLDGFVAWRQVMAHGGGEIALDLDLRKIRYVGGV